jgi:DNA-binding LacI/PurR family transcriptional regulator
LVVGKSFLIGVVVGNASNSFVPQAIQGIEDVAAEKGYGTLLMTSRDDSEREHGILQFMRQRNVDGVMISPMGAGNDSETRQLLRAMGVPVLYLFCQPSSLNRDDRFVCVDSEKVSFLAIEHLVQRGHRHIACFGLSWHYPQGVAKAVKASGERVKIETWSCDPKKDVADEVLTRWCAMKNRPTALFVAAGDELACDILHLAIRKGIKVPQDLAIVGVDDIPLAAKAVVPLTTVCQPKYEQGVCAAQTLFNLIEGQSVQSCALNPELIVRQST